MANGLDMHTRQTRHSDGMWVENNVCLQMSHVSKRWVCEVWPVRWNKNIAFENQAYCTIKSTFWVELD